MEELNRERVDIILKDTDEINFIKRALCLSQNATVKVTGTRSCDVIVNEGSESKAFGRYRTNVTLAIRLTGWQIIIKSDFKKILEVDDSVARILYDEGYNTISDLAKTNREELISIEKIDAGIVDKIRSRVIDLTENADEDYEEYHSGLHESLSNAFQQKQDRAAKHTARQRKTKGKNK